jgi:hypothetical protein
LSWFKYLWTLLEAVATQTKQIENANSEIKELRRDLNTLTEAVSRLKMEVDHEKATTKLLLDHYGSDNEHVKESIVAKFDVLTTRLDAKMVDFDNRLSRIRSDSKSDKLKASTDV